MNGSPSHPIKFRILIVDDDIRIRESSRITVKLLGLEPIVATGESVESLIKNAKDTARSKRCHLALVDTQLREGDRSDQSGIKLIPELKPALCIIHSGSDEGIDRTNAAAMNEAHKLGAVDYVKKGEKLSLVILEVLKKYWNWNLEYDLKKTRYTPKMIIEQLFPPGYDPPSSDVPEDEIDSLLRRVFRTDILSLDLENLDGLLLSGTTPFLRRSVVLFCEPRGEGGALSRREILKFAPAKDIEQETANYERFVQPHLQHQFTALVKDSAISWDIGLIRYTDETTGRRRRFTEWYADNQARQVKKAIAHLYKNTLRPWYNIALGTIHKSPGNIYEYYTDPNRFKRFSSHISSFADRNDQLTVELLDGITNPVVWAEENKQLSNFNTYWNTFVHGDLHSGNIIVDEEGHTYVIDYERTGQGYYLRDFVELEKDIRLRLLRLNNDDISLALYMDILLMKQVNPDRPPRWPSHSFSAFANDEEKITELRKAFTSILSIRKAAAQIVGLEDMREYYWALLMETLISVTNPRITGLDYKRALLSAVVISERLKLWHRPRREWPPKIFKDALSKNHPNVTSIKPQRLQGLKLRLTGLTDQFQFKVAVQELPNREPYAESTLPYQGDALIGVMKLLELGEYNSPKFTKKQTTALHQLELLQNDKLIPNWYDRIGHNLFDALMPAAGGVRTVFENTFHAKRDGGELQIIFDKDATDLASQPWELIHDGFPTEPRSAINVVRYIATNRQAQELTVPNPPCRVLYVTARPREFTRMAYDRMAVKGSIASLASVGTFEFEELEPHTHQALLERLMDSTLPPAHILHFDGHGTFARLCPQCGTLNQPHSLKCSNNECNASLVNTPALGYLLFETDTGEAELIETTKFLEGLPRSEVRLVVLSSCQSARVRGADMLLAGVGPGVILAGIPAVVAMQFSILDQNAIAFNSHFYKSLIQGNSLPNAVYKARTMLPEPSRWSPVLYLRSRDHQIHLCPKEQQVP